MGRWFHVAAPVAAPARFQGGRASQGPSLREEEGPRRRPRLPDEGEEAGEGPRGVPAGGRRRLASDVHHAPASEPHRPASRRQGHPDRKSTRLNSSHGSNSYAVFCLNKNTVAGRSAASVAAPNSVVSTSIVHRATVHKAGSRATPSVPGTATSEIATNHRTKPTNSDN